MANDPLKNSIRQVFTTHWLEEFANNSLNNYFMFISKPLAWPGTGDTGVPPTLVDSRLTDLDTWRHMLGAKRINANDVFFLIDRNTWTQNTVYDYYDDSIDMYDDRDSTDTANPKVFYVINTDNHVYKCLWNANGASSTEIPTGTNVSNSFTTSDGYIWKYMFTVLENDINYLSTEFIPVKLATALDSRVNQYNTQQNSIDGSIDFIIVSNGGSGYGGIVAPDGATFSVQAAGDATNVYLNTSAGASHSGVNEFYTGYDFTIIGGTGVGQTREIISYNGTTKLAGITPAWDINPATSSIYTISPSVVIAGDGTGAVARTVAVGSTISSVVMINRGSDYSWATATIGTTSGAGGIAATLRPFVSPQGGHGNNAIVELGVRDVVISTDLDRSEGSKLTVTNDYRQFGVVQNPTLNTGANTGDVAGTEIDKTYDISIKRPEVTKIIFGASAGYTTGDDFVVGELVIQGATPSQVKGEVVSWTPAASGQPGSILIAKEIIGPFASTTQLISGVSSGIGYYATGATLTDNLNLSNLSNTMFDSSGKGYLIGKESLANANITAWTTTGAKTGTLTVKDLSGTFLDSTRPKEYGELITHYTVDGTSYAFSSEIIENAEIVNVVVSADLPNVVYRQTHTLNITGTLLSTSTYTLDATAQGADSGAYGVIVDWTTGGSTLTGALNIVATNGTFTIGEEISLDGVTVSGGAALTTQNNPELVFDSGKILYIQNMRPIDRDPGQLEEIHINMGF